MMGKDFFRGHFQPRTCSGKKTPKSDRVRGNCINVVLIDIDNEQVSDVIVIDEPEFVEEKSHGSSVPRRDRKCPLQRVIFIDDDGDSDDAYHPGNIADGGGELDSDASSSKRFSPATGYMQNCACINVDDCHVVKEKVSASNLPKSKQTSPTKAAGGSCCGLDGFESGSSENDCSDCELMEVREEWEKAWVKRKRRVVNDQAGFDEQASSSCFHSTIYPDIGVENRTGQHAGSPVHSGPSNGKFVKESLSSFFDMGDGHMDGTDCNLGTGNSCTGSNQKVDQERFKFSTFGSKEEMQCIHQDSDPQSPESIRDSFSCSSKYRSQNFAGGVTGNSRFKKEMGGKESKYMDLNVEESERQEDNNGSALKNKNDNISEAHSNYASFDETHVSHDGVVSQQSCERWHNSGLRSHSEVISVQRNTLCSDLQHKQDRSCLVENGKPSDVGDALHVPGNGVTNSDERDIINRREKLKETEEYKRTIEEEWASRQRQLQIQAEEVQRLRKRKKAESMRLLDMQRRQKERIKEVRETQKKDEENMNMKEKLRVEIMKGLNNLEMTCVDMASLLRSLGIQVGGGFNPLPHEVHAAYKRALLKFHPDRASKSDIREQVEAEEKFKLISRMKEKLLSPSCY